MAATQRTGEREETGRPPRVGCVPYLVARPLVSGLLGYDVELTLDKPARLIEALHAGVLDVALASSIEYFRLAGSSIVPGVGIVAHGEMMSVQLFSRRPFEQIRSVALDPASRSGRALAQIVLAAREEPTCSFAKLQPGQDPADQPTDAYLLIGDPALRATLDPSSLPADVHYNIDLAACWQQLTGKPFTFAAWIVRPGVELGRLPEILTAARDRGMARRAQIAERAARESALPLEGLRRYLLEVCSYDLEADGVIEGLELFAHHAARLGLLDSHRALELYVS